MNFSQHTERDNGKGRGKKEREKDRASERASERGRGKQGSKKETSVFDDGGKLCVEQRNRKFIQSLITSRQRQHCSGVNNRAVLWVHVAAAASIRSPDLQRLFAFLISLFSWEFRSPYRRHLAFSLLLLLSLPLAPRRHRASLSLPAPLPPSLEIYANTRNDSPPKPFLTNGFLLGEGEGGRDLSIPVHPTPEFRRLPLRTWKIEFPFESFRPKNLTEKKKKIFSSRKLLETCSIRSCPLPSPFPTRFHPESDSLYRDSKCKRHPSSRLNRNRGQTVWPEIFICKSSSRCRV